MAIFTDLADQTEEKNDYCGNLRALTGARP